MKCHFVKGVSESHKVAYKQRLKAVETPQGQEEGFFVTKPPLLRPLRQESKQKRLEEHSSPNTKHSYLSLYIFEFQYKLNTNEYLSKFLFCYYKIDKIQIQHLSF